ncbi:MAG: NINE protein, partial [Prevotella conceptionensis]
NKAYVFYMFLGPFGAHRFYLGRIISAIFQLLGGLPFLIWLFLVVVAVNIRHELAVNCLQPTQQFFQQEGVEFF